MTDAIQLIGVIYKYAKMRNIPGPEFERIIVNSYDVAWQMQGNSKGSNVGASKKKPFAQLMKDAKKQKLDGDKSARALEEPIPISTFNAIQSYGLMQLSDKYFCEEKTGGTKPASEVQQLFKGSSTNAREHQ